MNADKRGLNTKDLSAFISVDLRPYVLSLDFFSSLFSLPDMENSPVYGQVQSMPHQSLAGSGASENYRMGAHGDGVRGDAAENLRRCTSLTARSV